MDEIQIKNQPILNKILNNINNNGNNVQAYILSGNDKENLINYAILFSKVLICPHKYKKGCSECNICNRIDKENFGELKIINPVNKIIKKEAILELKNEFKTKSIEGKNEVYIINDAETLNGAASNTILKFLEEPDSNIVAIFTTTNLDSVIKTIVSRCQVIKINNFQKKIGIDFIKKLTKFDEETIYKVIDFIKIIEKSSEDAIIDAKKSFFDYFSTKESLINTFNVILLYYKDMLNYKIKNKCSYYEINDIKSIADMQTDNLISKKITFILENIAKLEYNVNILLFIDNFIIGIGEIKDGKSNRN
ncbi:MAG: hypothetical protein ACI4U0_06595 [Candidatus Aphodocola sp.]